MGIAANSLCQICKVQDFIVHFFAECTAVKPMWKDIEKYLAIYTARSIKLSPSSILLGIDNSIASVNEQKIINHAILIRTMCISKFKYGKPTHLIMSAKPDSQGCSLHNKAVLQLLRLMLCVLIRIL